MITEPVSTAPRFNLVEGQKLAGCYKLKKRISETSGTLIWLAHDEVLGKDVSLHFLPAGVLRDKVAMTALRQEVKRARALIHPHILRVYELLEETDWAAISMDVFEGQSLAGGLRTKGTFEPADLNPWLGPLCQTIEEAHKINLIHRDIAAENVFVGGSKQFFIANFGISRVVQDSLKRADEKGSGNARLSTLSPQLLEAQTPTPRDDVYGIGTLLFELLTGQPVFAGDDIPRQIRSVVPPLVSEVRATREEVTDLPAVWNETIAACLHKAAESRPFTPTQIAAKLAGLATAKAAPDAAADGETLPAPAKRKPAEILAERAAQFRASGGSPSSSQSPEKADESSNQKGGKIERSKVNARGVGLEFSSPPRRSRLRLRLLVAVALLIVSGAAYYYHRHREGRARVAEKNAGAQASDGKEASVVTDSTLEPAVAAESLPVNKANMTAESEGARGDTPTSTLAVEASAGAAEGKQLPPEAAAEETVKQQQAASAAVAEIQRAIAEKAKVAVPEKKAVAEILSARRKKEDKVKAAGAAALLAQQVVEERVKLAEAAKKELADFDLEINDTLAAQAQTEMEMQALQQTLADRQQAATDAAKAVANAGKPRPQQGATPSPAAAPEKDPAPVLPAEAKGASFVNSLGLKFVWVGDVEFSVWPTRVKDFEIFAKAVNLKSKGWKTPSFRQGPEHPVVNVTWNEADAFCKWLTGKERKEGKLSQTQAYRLPSDLEWSAAVGLEKETGKTPEARDMGVPDVYPWGTEWPPPEGAGNYTGEETGSTVAIKGYNDQYPWTAPVGSFPPNRFGLCDMGGNVWQWCLDSWNNESKDKVLRGASWYNGTPQMLLLASCRVSAAPDSCNDNYGFRIVRATERERRSAQRP